MCPISLWWIRANNTYISWWYKPLWLLTLLLFLFKGTWSSVKVSQYFILCVSLTQLSCPVIILHRSVPDVPFGPPLTPVRKAVSSPIYPSLRQAPGESWECAASVEYKAEQGETGAAAVAGSAPAHPAPLSVSPTPACSNFNVPMGAQGLIQ